MKNTIKILCLLAVIIFGCSTPRKSQNYHPLLYSYSVSQKPDLCYPDSSMIGQEVKIWHTGGVLSRLNESDKFHFPSDEIRLKSGKSGWGNYIPQEGDIGTVIHIFHTEDSSIYLLKIGDNYIPVRCDSLTKADMLSAAEESEQEWFRDSISNVNYGNVCPFKIAEVNGNRSRADLTNIYRISETFACNLISSRVDTVLLCKYMYDDGSIAKDHAFVNWKNQGKGYMKFFLNKSRHNKPTESDVVLYNLDLIDFFFDNRIDTVTTKPKVYRNMSRPMEYTVQLYTTDYFYRESLPFYVFIIDDEYIISKWWREILLVGQQLSREIETFKSEL